MSASAKESLVFINNPDEFYLDLLFITDSKYISKQIPETIIAMFYNPAYHRVFLQIIPDKKAETLIKTIDHLQTYIN